MGQDHICTGFTPSSATPPIAKNEENPVLTKLYQSPGCFQALQQRAIAVDEDVLCDAWEQTLVGRLSSILGAAGHNLKPSTEWKQKYIQRLQDRDNLNKRRSNRLLTERDAKACEIGQALAKQGLALQSPANLYVRTCEAEDVTARSAAPAQAIDQTFSSQQRESIRRRLSGRIAHRIENLTRKGSTLFSCACGGGPAQRVKKPSTKCSFSMTPRGSPCNYTPVKQRNISSPARHIGQRSSHARATPMRTSQLA